MTKSEIDSGELPGAAFGGGEDSGGAAMSGGEKAEGGTSAWAFWPAWFISSAYLQLQKRCPMLARSPSCRRAGGRARE